MVCELAEIAVVIEKLLVGVQLYDLWVIELLYGVVLVVVRVVVACLA